MKFKLPYRNEELDLESFVARCLDGSDYERGSVETAQAQAENVTKAFGKLLEVLIERKIISKKDVNEIVLGYDP